MEVGKTSTACCLTIFLISENGISGKTELEDLCGQK